MTRSMRPEHPTSPKNVENSANLAGMKSQSLAILGSTGSIGTQALEVIANHRDRFHVSALAAGGAQADLLARQILTERPQAIAVADETRLPHLREAVMALARDNRLDGSEVWRALDIHAGPGAASQIAASGADTVLNGITGSIGLAPTLAALEAGSRLALANKESLVAGGALVRAAMRTPDQIVPVDSEHSAMAQAWRAGRSSEVARLILTASGGPFRGKTRADLEGVTPEQALRHPTWAMGPVVTINSSTLMNKALELIEAHLLFDVGLEDIVVVVHPQSIVHSMVEFHDGSTLAQASPPDMKLPIALGLSWPERLSPVSLACDWTEPVRWEFEPVDNEVFPALNLARQAVAASPLHPAVFNAANEQAVARFLAGKLPYLKIVDTVARVLDEYEPPVFDDLELAHVSAAEDWARRTANEKLGV